MHRKNGEVLKKLKREGKIKDDLYFVKPKYVKYIPCLLYTSDAADEEDSVDLGGRRIIKKKNKDTITRSPVTQP
ncbi:hypothetical protein CDFC105_93892 [Clostridioides difficile]|nr:hypothetical protein CDFC105_93892 [Clostridioides difficile]